MGVMEEDRLGEWWLTYLRLGGNPADFWSVLPAEYLVTISDNLSALRLLLWKRRRFEIDPGEEAALVEAFETITQMQNRYLRHPRWSEIDQRDGFDKPRGRPRNH